MRRLRYSAIILILILTAGLFGCGKSSDKSKALPELVIGSDTYKPYNYYDENGNPAGIDVELAEEACRRMGYKPVFRQIKWDEKEICLENGEIDCVWSCFSMDGRESDYLWARQYMKSRQLVAVLPGSDIYNLSDLEGKRIAVQMGSKPEEMFLGRTDGRIPDVKNVYCLLTVDELASSVWKNYTDACAGHEEALSETFKTAGIAYRFLNEPLIEANLGVAFLKGGDSVLCEKLEKALCDMANDGTTAEILKKYGYDPEKLLGGTGR